MSTNGTSTHGHSCRCPRCSSAYVSSPGMGFGTDSPQQGVGPGSLIQPPPPSQAQIEQGRQDLQAMMNMPQLPTGGVIWDDPSPWRTAFRNGTRPTQYAYPTTMDIDILATPAVHQSQGNVPNSTHIAAATQGSAPRVAAGRLAPSNTPVTQPGGRTQDQPRTNRGSRSSYSTSSALRGRGSSANATYRTNHSSRRTEQQRQTTSRVSRLSQSVAEDTPETEESSDDDSDES